MNAQPQRQRPAFDYLDGGPPPDNTVTELMQGLSARHKRVSPKYFYDAHGSALFEKITEQPEYYPTRTERSILKRHCTDIAGQVGRQRLLLEPGAGSCEKVRLLLEALQPAAYVPMDISGDFLCQSAQRLKEEYPWLPVTALRTDFTHMPALPETLPDAPRCLFYPGSTLGNFTPAEARRFLMHAARLTAPDGQLLLGIDLHKDPEILHAAYNDAAGVTAAFNLNLLNHLNHLLHANFEPGAFRHVAGYHQGRRRIEMYLESRHAQQVRCGDTAVRFRRGERILTEYSCKYTRQSFGRLARQAGLRITGYWQDDAGLFAVFALQAGPQRHGNPAH